MATGELERGDLEETFDGAEVGDDDLPVADGAVEDIGADSCVRCGVLEDAGASDAGALDAGAGEQLAPFAGRIRRA